LEAVPATFREVQGTFSERSGNIQEAFREQLENIQLVTSTSTTWKRYLQESGNVNRIFRERSVNIQEAFRESAGNI
jgi:Leucine-rich repeat (LRR) protein